MTSSFRQLWPLAGLAALLAIAWACYHPGLSGGFLFDDFVNLDLLGASGRVDNWPSFWRYITSGTSDPGGRPLSLLSFLLDARDWPADPAPFLRTNVLLHLCNGALLFALLRRLGRVFDGEAGGRADAAALLAAGLWLLHPLLVSTTLYVVQREAMLPTTFVLLGLLAYAHGRLRFSHTGGVSGVAWMVAGIVGGTVLAVACKANGLLLPALAWALEATVLGRAATDATLDDAARRRLSRMRALLLVVPTACIALYLARFLLRWDVAIASRPWTVGQRLLTEPRVLLQYLDLLAIPRSVTTGLYNDDYVASTGLLQPATTLPALFAVLALLASAFAWRRRWPRYAAAVLFFFAGHLLEPTTVPLELYFEHRNYLPAMLLFWPLAWAICAWRSPRYLRATVAIALLALLAFTTAQRARFWAHPQQQAALWARQNPGSSRAQAAAAIADLQASRPQRALARLMPLWKAHPDDLQVAFNAINARCVTGGLSLADKRALGASLRQARDVGGPVFQWLAASIDVAGSGRCRGLGIGDVAAWIAALSQNPVVRAARTRDEDLEPLLAQLALARGDADGALSHFNRGLAALPRPDVAARQASMLASAGDYEQALAHLDAYERLKSRARKPGAGMSWLHFKVLAWQGYWPHEMAVLRAKLHTAIRERDRAAGAS